MGGRNASHFLYRFFMIYFIAVWATPSVLTDGTKMTSKYGFSQIQVLAEAILYSLLYPSAKADGNEFLFY